tara:strand:+ start:806 stop:1450 length:645 start_codon:yes stop_codon:yes gene_type:complete
MTEEKFIQAITDALEGEKKRNFVESVDVAFNLKGVDLNDPNKRINDEISLPNGRGKDMRIGVFARGPEFSSAANNSSANRVISSEDLEDLADDKRKARKFTTEFDYFLAETTMMADIGKSLGVVLGPRGKMPRPVPPSADLERMVTGLQNIVPLRSKDKSTFHVPIGTNAMSNDNLAENLEVIVKRVISHLERGDQNLASVWVKTTMGKAVRVV